MRLSSRTSAGWIKRLLIKPYQILIDTSDKRTYNSWLKNNRAIPTTADRIPFTYEPLISIVVPTYNTPHKYFIEMIESVMEQTYRNWELVLVDDASPENDVRDRIMDYAARDPRIKYKFLDHNHHIAGATNVAIRMAKGEFVSLFDHDDILMPQALNEIVTVLNQDKNLDFIYTDEDKIDESGKRNQPLLKPSLNEDFLRSVNYITHFTTIRKSVLEKYGYENGDYNGAQDWELFLRIIRSIPEERVRHIPKVLYSWRVHNASTAKSLESKPYVLKAQEKAITADLISRGYNNFILKRDNKYSGQWRVGFQPSTKSKVTIIVTDSSLINHVKKEIADTTSYKNYEVLGLKRGQNLETFLKELTSEHIIIADRRLLIHTASWIEDMMGDAERREVGFVLSWCPSKIVIDNLSSMIGVERANLVAGLSRRQVVKHLYLTTRYNLNTVHAGVVMISREKLLKLGSTHSNEINLTELSSEARSQGYCNLYNPYVKVIK